MSKTESENATKIESKGKPELSQRRVRQIKADQDHDKMKLASQFAITQGPYRGRNPERPFKGTKRQRLAPTKRARILQSMTAMPEIIAKFRQRVAAEKAAKAPKILPGQL